MATIVNVTEFLQLTATTDDGLNTNFVFKFTDITNFTKHFFNHPEVADAVVDQALDITPVVTGKILLIQTDNTISIKLNGTINTAIVVDKFILLNSDSITSVHISNSSGNIAKLSVIVLGI